MKKFLILILVFVMMLTIVGCTGDQADDAAAPAGDSASDSSNNAAADAGAESTFDRSSMTIAYVATNAGSTFQASTINYLTEISEAEGWELITFDSLGDASKQADNLAKAISQEVDAIIVNPVEASAIITVCTEAMQQGIPVIDISQDMDANFRGTGYSCFIGTDDYEGGKIAAEAYKKVLPDGGNILEVAGSAGASSTTKRHDGFRDGLEGSNVKVIDSKNVLQWTTADAMAIMEDFIVRYDESEYDGIYCHWDGGAVAVIQALEDAGIDPSTKYILGYDGDAAGFENVRSGKGWATMYQNLPEFCRQSVDMACKLVEEGTVVADPDELIIDLVCVTAENEADYEPW